MKAAIISLGSTSSELTAVALKKYFQHVDQLNIKHVEVKLSPKGPQVIYKGNPLGEYDCIYVKGSFKFVQIMRSITSVLQDKTYLPIKDASFTIGHDKLLTQLALDQASIPMPTTYISSSTKEARSVLERINYPIMIKFPSGTQGKGVTYAESLASAKSILDAFASLNQPVIIQEYVECNAEDYRAFVVGDKVVAAMKRTASEGEKRSNIHAGATGSAVELDLETKQIAIRAAKAIKADVCGVDIIMSKNGPQVIEVNLSPGVQGIMQATGIDVPDKIAAFLYDQSKQFHAPKAPMVETDFPKIIASISLSKNKLTIPELIGKFSQIDEGDEVEITSGKKTIVITKTS